MLAAEHMGEVDAAGPRTESDVEEGDVGVEGAHCLAGRRGVMRCPDLEAPGLEGTRGQGSHHRLVLDDQGPAAHHPPSLRRGLTPWATQLSPTAESRSLGGSRRARRGVPASGQRVSVSARGKQCVDDLGDAVAGRGVRCRIGSARDRAGRGAHGDSGAGPREHVDVVP